MNTVRHKVLLIDDCTEDLETYRRYLLKDTENQYNILEALTGAEALLLCRQQLPDVIVVDYLLPDMDGLDCIDDLKSLFGKACPPIIMITGQGSEAVAVLAIKRGAADYLIKNSTTQLNFLTSVENGLEKNSLSKQLEESETRFQATFNQAAAGIAHVGLDGKWLLVNQKFCDILGYSRLELQTLSFEDITYPDDRNLDVEHVVQILAGDIQTYSTQKRYIHKDNTLVWIDLNVSLVHSASGLPEYFICVVQDITDRKQVEESLQEAHQQVVSIWEGMTDAYTMLDNEWRVIYTNPTSMRLLSQLTNLEPEQILGTSHWELFPWTIGKNIELEYRRAVNERVPVYLEFFYEPYAIWFEIRAYPSKMGLGIYFHDISDRKRREANTTFLAEIAEDFSRLLTPNEIMQTVGAKIGTFLNVAYCHFISIDATDDEIVFLDHWNAKNVPPLPNSVRLWEHISADFYEKVCAGETIVSNDTQTNNALINAISFITVPFNQDGEWKYLFSVHDIHPRNWRDDEIELVEELANQMFLRLERARAEVAVAADLKDTQMLRDLSARLIFEDNTQVLYNEILAVAITLMQADGGSFQILDEGTQQLMLLASQGFNQDVLVNFERIDASYHTSCGIALATGKRSFINFDIPENDDPNGYLRSLVNAGYHCSQSTPLFSRSGKLIGMVSTYWYNQHKLVERELRFLDLLVRQAADSVEQRQTELEIRKLEQQFYQTQRLESLGVLASGIAHDLNNILTPILAVAQLLPLKLPNLEQKNRQFLKILEDSSKRGVELVKQITAFARGAEGKQVPLQLKHLLKEVEQVTKSTFPKSIQISIQIATSNLWTVSADPTQIHQVLMNLCVNARDAMPQGGTLTLSAENFHVDRNYARMNLQAKIGNYVMITVSDTGCGMSKGVQERIFDPFFTTKEIGKGTGLGLSTVNGIIKSHGGIINVRSEVGKGSQFQVFLRAIEASVTENTNSSEITLGNNELILVVDDEIFVRETTLASLEELNYRVLIAGDGIQALSLYAEYKDDISLVLMDIQMPSLDGFQAIRILQRMNPCVKIIVITGLASNQRTLEENQINVQGFLLKPYTIEELLKAIK